MLLATLLASAPLSLGPVQGPTPIVIDNGVQRATLISNPTRKICYLQSLQNLITGDLVTFAPLTKIWEVTAHRVGTLSEIATFSNVDATGYSISSGVNSLTVTYTGTATPQFAGGTAGSATFSYQHSWALPAGAESLEIGASLNMQWQVEPREWFVEDIELGRVGYKGIDAENPSLDRFATCSAAPAAIGVLLEAPMSREWPYVQSEKLQGIADWLPNGAVLAIYQDVGVRPGFALWVDDEEGHILRLRAIRNLVGPQGPNAVTKDVSFTTVALAEDVFSANTFAPPYAQRVAVERGDWWTHADRYRTRVLENTVLWPGLLASGAKSERLKRTTSHIQVGAGQADIHDDAAENIFNVSRMYGPGSFVRWYNIKEPEDFDDNFFSGAVPGPASMRAAFSEAQRDTDAVTAPYINGSLATTRESYNNHAGSSDPDHKAHPPVPPMNMALNPALGPVINAINLKLDANEAAAVFTPDGLISKAFFEYAGQLHSSGVPQCLGSIEFGGDPLGSSPTAGAWTDEVCRQVLVAQANGAYYDYFALNPCFRDTHAYHPPGYGKWIVQRRLLQAIVAEYKIELNTVAGPGVGVYATAMESSVGLLSAAVDMMFIPAEALGLPVTLPELGPPMDTVESFLAQYLNLNTGYYQASTQTQMDPVADHLVDVLSHSQVVPMVRVIFDGVKYSQIPDRKIAINSGDISKRLWQDTHAVLSSGQLTHLIAQRNDGYNPDASITRLTAIVDLYRGIVSRVLAGGFRDFHNGRLQRPPAQISSSALPSNFYIGPVGDSEYFLRVPHYDEAGLVYGCYAAGDGRMAIIASNPWVGLQQTSLNFSFTFNPSEYPQFAALGTTFTVDDSNPTTSPSPLASSIPMNQSWALTDFPIKPGEVIFWTFTAN